MHIHINNMHANIYNHTHTKTHIQMYGYLCNLLKTTELHNKTVQLYMTQQLVMVQDSGV